MVPIKVMQYPDLSKAAVILTSCICFMKLGALEF